MSTLYPSPSVSAVSIVQITSFLGSLLLILNMGCSICMTVHTIKTKHIEDKVRQEDKESGGGGGIERVLLKVCNELN